jgi:hypothetical protein
MELEERDIFYFIVCNCLMKVYRTSNYYSWKVSEVYINNKRFDDFFHILLKEVKLRCEVKKVNNNTYIVNGYLTHFFKILAEFNITFTRNKTDA